jgi:hypothetical protein
MTESAKSRRELLLGTAAWVGGIAALAAAKPAGAAMQRYDVSPKSPLGIAVANRCIVSSSEHDAIKSQLLAQLAANPLLQTLTERCPICGCPIIVSR